MDASNKNEPRETYALNLQSSVKQEMNAASDTSHPDIKVHKNPLSETTKYLFKNDVYDIFKVSYIILKSNDSIK